MIHFLDNKNRRMGVVRPLIWGFYWCEQAGGGYAFLYHIKYILMHWEGFVRLVAGLDLFEKYLNSNEIVTLSRGYISVRKNDEVNLNIKVERDLIALGWVRLSKDVWTFAVPLNGGNELRSTLKKYLE